MGAESQSKTRLLPPGLGLGQSLNQFRLETILGEGGMGVVYRAYDSQLCRPVALKVLPPELTSNPERRQRFLQEARAAGRINHPAVAQIFRVDEADGVTFIVMELVEGKTIRELIQSQELDLLGSIDIVIQIAEALARAHDLGIVHRDIKPANIMVTEDGHVKILDFGLAKLSETSTSGMTLKPGEELPLLTTVPGVLMGTAAYMSPEQVRGLPVDGRADLFSVGVLLFEMLTGASPFQRESFMDSLHAIAFSETPPLQTDRGRVPDELRRIVGRCLRKDAAERYPDAHVLARDLRDLRKSTAAGLAVQTSWRVQFLEAWDRFVRLPTKGRVQLAAVMILVGAAFYLSVPRLGLAGLITGSTFAVFLFRRIRNQSQRMKETFVRQTAKIPEVMIISCREQQFTILVEHPTAQLYVRINRYLNAANRRLYWGAPMTVSIQPGASAEGTRQLLSGPGVCYVRTDVLEPGGAAVSGG